MVSFGWLSSDKEIYPVQSFSPENNLSQTTDVYELMILRAKNVLGVMVNGIDMYTHRKQLFFITIQTSGSS